MESCTLLHRYRSDRRKLLEFLLSFGVVRAPRITSLDLVGIDLDTTSADYVLECIQSGGDFDPSEASKRFSESLIYPIMLNSSTGKTYFLLSRPELSGSEPVRSAPQVGMKISTDNPSSSAERLDVLIGRRNMNCKNDNRACTSASSTTSNLPSQPAKNAKPPSLGLPTMNTGLSDDDIQQTAYEVLLASFMLSGRRVDRYQDSKNEKGSKFSNGQEKNVNDLSSAEDCNSVLLEVIRVQLEISEAMDAITKKGLKNFNLRMMHRHIDVPHITLQLLSIISSSDFPNERSYIRWLRRQAYILEELFLHSGGFISDAPVNLSNLIVKLRNAKEWIPAGRHAEALKDLKSYASQLSCLPGKFGIPHETYYWTANYHFNIKLYERLLYSVFDVLECGQLLQEVEEILEVFQLTWPIFGITKKMHHILYAWVLFLQFIQTGDLLLLNNSVHEVHKALSHQDRDTVELYTNSLSCSTEAYSGRKVLNLVDAVLFNINMSCRNQLEDYHLYFDQDNSATFQYVLELAVLTGSHTLDEGAEIKYIYPMPENLAASMLQHMFITKSIEAAYGRVINFLDGEHLEKDCSLAMLADKLKAIAEKEYTFFSPVLTKHFAEAVIISTVILHQLYGKHLKPFLEVMPHLSGSTIEVLAASNSLERYLVYILYSACRDRKESAIDYIHPYQINHFCSPLILDWVQTQEKNILEWTQRAVNAEDWEPLSSQPRQASSIIEVFRIIEETIDQFFNLNIPMDVIHLRSLLTGVGQSLEAYVLHIVKQQVDKSMLYPATPALTRYAESVNPFARRKPVESSVLDEGTMNLLNYLTLPKLCVKLNTLSFIREQLDMLEDTIKDSWEHLQKDNSFSLNIVKEDLLSPMGVVDELFTTFDEVRISAISASDIIVEFIGARAIYWDLRDSFIFKLYQGTVENARLEVFIPMLDEVLNHVCDLIVDTLRDQVVSSIFQATMDGFTWVMLDGGPSRLFSLNDTTMMQEDLNLLKDLYIANGQGLPEDVVEKESRVGEEILELYSMKADAIIEMLITASQQQQIPQPLQTSKPQRRFASDPETLLRILCHKKDKCASTFLKIQYQLPKSSDYEVATGMEPLSNAPLLSGMLRRKASFNWSNKGQSSFRNMKKKLREATLEIRLTQ